MPLLPDPAELRAAAARIGQHAHAARTRADGLAAAVAAAGWHGPAADAFAFQAFVVVGALRAAAGRLDDAADALRRHADRVSGLLTLAEQAVRAGVDGVEEVLAHPDAVLHGLAHEAGGLIHAGGTLVSGGADAVGNLLDAAGL